MSKRTYHPDRGVLVEMNFQPAAGCEIDKRRPAIILRPVACNRRSGLCMAFPRRPTSRPARSGSPSDHPGLLPRPSLFLCDYLKNYDYRERAATFLAKVDPSLAEQLVGNVLDLIDPVP